MEDKMRHAIGTHRQPPQRVRCSPAKAGARAASPLAQPISMRQRPMWELPTNVQAKLTIASQGDAYEQEADRVSEQIARMPAPQVLHACACGGGCLRCQIDKPHPSQPQPQVRTKPSTAGVSGQAVAPPIVHDALRSPGQPLETGMRSFMESGFGHDFSRVRVHSDSTAGASADALHARAYTVGSEVVFVAGQYAPGRLEGRKLLAHELTHVVQQSAADTDAAKAVMRQAKPVASEFEGCAVNQQNQIDAAVQNGKTALNRAIRVVATAWGNPGTLSAAHRQLLLKHLHTVDRADLRDLLGTYISVKRAFEDGLEFQCEPICEKSATAKVCGYAYNTQWFGGRGPIHICFDSAGCDFLATAANNQVALVIHEAAHRHAGIDDKVYAWDPKYAALSADEAMDNADSYAWFAVHL